ncbi:carbohydrate kinase [Dankookia rubra]|uniref:Carbohydrate kinase n=1 Tax=Dankookia rubra TaxID=1442381 RepID=A0A4V3A9S7_9PROT|nr:FGGY-family carbohydrate kinase [Dankookia rubra]TDH60435.1 carbohydrate kinase [Dankookia rubra]
MGTALGIDLGTSGLRVAVLDAAGRVVAQAGVPLPPSRATEPAAWLEALETALTWVPLDAVRRIAVAGTSGTLLTVDAAGAPVGPPAMYNAPAPAEAVAAIARIAPAGSPARGATSPLAKAQAMQARPGVARLLHQADWIAGTLLGRFRHSDENNALKTGYDPVTRRWPDWLAATGLDTSLLPEVAVPGSALGELDSNRFGLPRGAVVCAGTTDGCASFLAASAGAPGEGVTVLGSTLTLKLACDRPVVAPEYSVYSHRLGGAWLAGGSSNSGGRALARHFDPAALARLSARIDPARPSGLDYYPLPGPGERFPIADPGLPPRETPRPADDAAFLQGLLEGVARIEALGYQRLAALGAPPLLSVRSLGSGAGNAAWTAIRARHLGVPMLPARSEEAAAGAAQLALRGV